MEDRNDYYYFHYVDKSPVLKKVHTSECKNISAKDRVQTGQCDVYGN